MGCLVILYPDFDFTFLFDHDLGHTNIRVDGLYVADVNISYGGSVYSMHITMVAEVGSFKRFFAVGYMQHMVFKDSYEGPFWLSDAERLSSKFNSGTFVIHCHYQLLSRQII